MESKVQSKAFGAATATEALTISHTKCKKRSLLAILKKWLFDPKPPLNHTFHIVQALHVHYCFKIYAYFLKKRAPHEKFDVFYGQQCESSFMKQEYEYIIFAIIYVCYMLCL
jgi:hypothetical protein